VKLGFHDTLDAWGIHFGGAFWGSICTGWFADKHIALKLDGTKIEGGWINGHYQQMGYQVCVCMYVVCVCVCVYAFF
jgi:ammonium transporter, Amt family